MMLIGWEKKNSFCEGNEREALFVTINGVSLVAKAEIKVGKIHNTEGWVNECFECIIFGNRPNISKMNS